MILWKVFNYTIDGENDHRYFTIKDNAEKYYSECLKKERQYPHAPSIISIEEVTTED